MIKRVLMAAGLLFSTAALAQQIDISGKDFESGAGDARLAKIAQQAAAQGKALSVTAPAYWQAKIEAKLHAGAANVKVRMNSGFFENVLVSVVDNTDNAAANAKRAAERAQESRSAAEAKAREKRAAQARAAAARRAEADRIAAQKAARERAAEQAAAAARARAAQAAAAKAAAEKVAADKAAAEKAAAARAAAQKAAAEKAAAEKIAATRRGMLQNLNGGHAATGTLSVSQLKRDDQLYVDGSVRGVVRRSGARIQFYWLRGDLNLNRIELMPAGAGHYAILRPIENTANPVLRTRVGGMLHASVPASGSAERRSFQRNYADGQNINSTLRPGDLRSGDVIYTGKSAAVVVRRSSSSFLRYWLVGNLNLGQVALIKQGANTYRVLSDTVK